LLLSTIPSKVYILSSFGTIFSLPQTSNMNFVEAYAPRPEKALKMSSKYCGTILKPTVT
jgi:hypothetical protein